MVPLYQRIVSMENKLDRIESNVDPLTVQVENLEAQTALLTQRVENLEAQVTSLAQETEYPNAQITGVKLTIENEIRTNISIVAEGHLDIIRKLDLNLQTAEKSDSRPNISAVRDDGVWDTQK